MILATKASPKPVPLGFEVTNGPDFHVLLVANVNASGGLMEIGSRGPAVSVTGLLTGARDLERAVVRSDPVRPVVVGDVADVRFGPASIRTGDAGVNGDPGVALVVFKQPDVDTVALSERVERALGEIAATAPAKRCSRARRAPACRRSCTRTARASRSPARP